MGNQHINEGVHIHNVAAVATISFAHPKHNCFPQAQLKALTTAIDSCAQDDTVRVILLQSDPTKAFCAGASFDELVAVQTPQVGDNPLGVDIEKERPKVQRIAPKFLHGSRTMHGVIIKYIGRFWHDSS